MQESEQCQKGTVHPQKILIRLYSNKDNPCILIST
jgi:hypothetical protein